MQLEPVRLRTLAIWAGNLLGAAFAAYLLAPNLRYFLDTHAAMALVFTIQQAWVGAIFLVRRRPRTVSWHPLDWGAAYGGWLIGTLVRPGGPHLPWSSPIGLSLQILDLAVWAWAFANLSRSYGIVPAHRELVTSGPYRLVRHPLYAAYMIGGAGYLIQSLTVRNILVTGIVVALQLVRVTREERHLAGTAYAQYRDHVRWRLVPGVW